MSDNSIENNENNFPFDKMEISGLHGEKGKIATLDLKGNLCIFIGKNGAGKTTCLKILNAYLNGLKSELISLPWDEISLYKNGEILEKLKFLDFLNINEENFNEHLHFNSAIEKLEIKKIAEIYFRKKSQLLRGGRKRAFRNGVRMGGYSRNQLIREIEKEVYKNADISVGLDNVSHILRMLEHGVDFENSKPNYGYHAKFLSTYRRVEDSIQEIISSDDESGFEDSRYLQGKIKFGMSDVENLLEERSQSIKDRFSQGFQGLGNSLLDSFAESRDDTQGENELSEEDFDNMKERIKSNLTENTREKKLEKIEEKFKENLNNEKYSAPLNLLLLELKKSYEDTKDDNNLLLDFCNAVTGYLSDGGKELEYDQSKVEHRLKQKHNDSEINFSDLSSGEQQMISMLADAYFEKDDFALIIDEPEISLSTEWQSKILTDLLNAPNCKKLIVATHSPFVVPEENSTGILRPLDVEYEEVQ